MNKEYDEIYDNRERSGGGGKKPVILLIGGTDPSGGAGLAADLKAVAALGCYGCFAVTAVTVQNSGKVSSWRSCGVGEVKAQVKAVCADGRIDGVKSGMLGSPEIVKGVAESLGDELSGVPYVLDPVMVAGSGDSLSGGGMVEAVREELLPRAALCTPNLDEASQLAGFSVSTVDEMVRAGKLMCKMGCGAVLVKGGHLEGEPSDVLVLGDGSDVGEKVGVGDELEDSCHRIHSDVGEGIPPDSERKNGKVKMSRLEEGVFVFPGERIVPGKVHGTGCTLGSAIAALMGAGRRVDESVCKALEYLRFTIRNSFPMRNGVLLDHFPDHLSCSTGKNTAQNQ